MLARHALTDAEWVRLESLLPKSGPEADDRRFLDAVLWIARTGAAWRDPPERLGNWNSRWRRFDRRAASGVWAEVFEALRDPDLEQSVLDSTVIRAHPAAAGAKKKRTAPAAKPSGPSAGAGAGSAPGSTGPSAATASRCGRSRRRGSPATAAKRRRCSPG